MAFTKDEKTKMLEQYEDWLVRSRAVFMLEFNKMNMKEIDGVRAKAREAGAEMHVVKNTIFSLALDRVGAGAKDVLEKTTLVGFAFDDVPGLAKIVNEAARSDVFKVKGGLLDRRAITASDIKALADMPPLPVVRAQLLGVLSAPASKLVRTLAEPARGLAAVVKAYSERDQQAVPAA